MTEKFTRYVIWEGTSGGVYGFSRNSALGILNVIKTRTSVGLTCEQVIGGVRNFQQSTFNTCYII